ncbi:MAG: DUF1330 domain-containing protein [Erythrobacter sp.]|uniref:DUF1330 domain-containing protein n=1 Tax=Erythrobacter sp. TaxID=1042 RepID=UPI0032967E9E
MPAYLIGTIDIEDTEAYSLYRSFNPSLVEAAGGKYIIKGKPVAVLEGSDFRSRFVMIEFANEAALKRFYDSAEYSSLRPIREKSSKSSLAVVNTDETASTRTAFQIQEFGEAVELCSVTSPLAEVGHDEVRIQPTLIAVNPVDWKIRDGILAALPFQFPHSLGCEGVGVVEAVGEGVKGFQTGQRVMAHSSLLRGGWFADRVDVPANQCSLVPAQIADEHAASLSVASLTAAQTIGLHEGPIGSALVIGASGAVGSIAVALLNNGDSRVDAICSASNSAYVTALGANVLPPQQAAEQEYDFVLDASGGPAIEAGYRSLAKGGTLVSIVQPVDEVRALENSAKAIRYSVQPNGEQLSRLMAEYDVLPEPRIAALMPLAEVNAALHLSKAGRVRGKILLKP